MPTCNIPHALDILQSKKILSVLTLKIFNNITAEVLQIMVKQLYIYILIKQFYLYIYIYENIQDSVFKCEVLVTI